MSLPTGFHGLWPTPIGVHRYARAEAFEPLLVRVVGAMRAISGVAPKGLRGG
jgi:hypothetical protein